MKIYSIMSALLVAVAATGCGSSASEGHHHDDNVQITSYNETYELYAEVSPLAVGHESSFLLHLTRLDDFKPLDSAKVTVSLIAGDNGVRAAAETSGRPGIYKCTLTPDRSGSAKLVVDVVADSRESRFVIDGLTVYSDHHEAEEAAEDAAVTSSNGVAFTKEMSWKVDFATTCVEPRPMGQIIHTVGRIQPSQGDVRTVTARNAGTLTYAMADLTDGATVSAGQRLFTVDGSTVADNNLNVRYTEALNNYNTARADYERKSELAKDRLVTQSELQRSRNEYDNAKALYESLRQGFAGGASAVVSPITGYVTGLLANNGEHVEAGQPLATVAQNRDLFINAEVPSAHYRLLSSITDATFTTSDGQLLFLSELDGSVVSYGRTVSTDSPLIPVIFRINDTSELLPGTFVDTYIMAGDPTPVLTVPNGALIEEMGNYFVYVQLTPEYFEKREVTIGRTDGRNTVVTSGLSQGERVVSKGAVLVKLAHASGTLDAHSGHVH